MLHIWELKEELIDSYKEQVITINGQHPGPTIRAHLGERVSVRVMNNLSEYVAIRWHNTLPNEATRPISPGETFTYTFFPHQLGESEYESCYEMQKVAGLRGLIDVLPR